MARVSASPSPSFSRLPWPARRPLCVPATTRSDPQRQLLGILVFLHARIFDDVVLVQSAEAGTEGQALIQKARTHELWNPFLLDKVALLLKPSRWGRFQLHRQAIHGRFAPLEAVAGLLVPIIPSSSSRELALLGKVAFVIVCQMFEVGWLLIRWVSLAPNFDAPPGGRRAMVMGADMDRGR